MIFELVREENLVAPWKFVFLKTSIFALEAKLSRQISADSSSTETLLC